MIPTRRSRHRLSRSTRRKVQWGLAVAIVLSLMTAAVPSSASVPYASFWGSRASSTARAVDMNVPINVGTRFRVARSGQVMGLRVYLLPAPRTVSTASLYDTHGRLMTSTRFTGSGRGGWRDVYFRRPVSLRAGSVVTAALNLPAGHWMFSPGGLSKPATHGDLTALGGVYGLGSRPVVPTKRTSDALYVDVMWKGTGHRATTTPTPRTTASPTSTSAPKPTAAKPTATATTKTTQPSTTTTKAPASTTTTTAPAASSAIPACLVRPSASNTGAKGTLASSSVSTVDKSGTTLQNVSVPGNLMVTGDNVTIRNVKVQGTVTVRGDHALVDHVSAKGIAVSGSVGTTVQYSNMSGGNDASGVTSDTGRAKDIVLQYNYIHSPNPSPTAHYDGTQVRGVDGLKILCSTYELGTWESTYNAAIYMENANGGTTNVTVANNWLDGGGITLYVNATNLRVTGNKFGRAYHWDVCRNTGATFNSSGNSWADSGAALNPCG